MALREQNPGDQTLDNTTLPASPRPPAAVTTDTQSQETLDGGSTTIRRPAIVVPEIDGYEITGRLGEGGMGVVWKATQHGTHRPVALKLMSAASFGSERARLRFQREVDLTARLEHPHIARVYDGGENRGICYYAMEFIDGVPLDQHVRERKFTRPQILELMKTICEAVQFAHQKGVIHRDLKPANILVDKEGKPRVLDFGLAKALSDDDGQMLSMDMGAAGTPAYMSPEQAAGHLDQVDTRSDVYTLGVILFYLLSGKYPHDVRGSALEVMKRISEQEPCRLKDIEPKTDRDLEAVLTRTLSREPERRYGTAGDLAADLGRYLNGEPVLAQPPTMSYVLSKRLKKHRLPLGIAAGVCAVLLGMAVWSYVRVTHERNAAQSAKDVALAANVEKEHQRLEAENQRNEAFRQRAEAQQQRAEAQQQKAEADRLRVAAETQQRRAELRTAEGLLTEGNALGSANRWGDARAVYEEASDSFRKLEVPLVPVDAGLTKSYARSPIALLTLMQSSPVRAVAVCPDGSTVVTGCDDKMVRIWDLKKGRLLRTLSGHTGGVHAVEVSADGRFILSGSDDTTLKLWDFKTKKELKTFSGHTGNVRCVAISADGRTAISGGDDHFVRTWDMESGRQTWVSSDQTRIIKRVCFMPDGRSALSMADWIITKWDLTTHAEDNTLKQKVLGYWDLRVSATGERMVLGGVDTVISLLDPRGKEVHALRGHAGQVQALAILPDGTTAVSASDDRTVKVWDLDEGKETRTFNGHTSGVMTVSFAAGGKLVVSGSIDRTVKLWDIKDTEDVRILPGEARALAISPDGRTALIARAYDPMELVDLATGRAIRKFRRMEKHAEHVAFLPNGKFALSANGELKTLTLWDLATGDPVRVMKGHEANVIRVLASPDGSKAISCDPDGNINWWDLGSGKLIRKFATGREPADDAALSADGRVFVSIGHQTLRPWDLQTGSSHAVRLPTDPYARNVALCPGNTQVLISQNNLLELFDLQTGHLVRTFNGHSNLIHQKCVAISADGRFILSGSVDKTMKIWDLQTAKELQSFEHSGQVACLAMSPDCHWALCGINWADHNYIEIWDWTRPATYREMETPVREAQAAVQANPDDPGALAVLGRWWAFRGIHDWAAELLEKARAGGADVSPLILGRCYWQLDRFADARQEFAKALAQAKDEKEQYYLQLCIGALDRAKAIGKR